MSFRSSTFRLIFMAFGMLPGVLLISCNDRPHPVSATSHIRMLDDSIIDYHRGVLRTENQEISDFLARYGWKMKTTSTGLRYLIYKKGIGKKPVKGMTVEIGYSVRLLDGTLCYSSDSLGNKRFRIGYEEVESGLEEGIFLLNQGDRAKLIIPSHLAFGLLGDQKKIPPGSALVYDVDLVTLHNR